MMLCSGPQSLSDHAALSRPTPPHSPPTQPLHAAGLAPTEVPNSLCTLARQLQSACAQSVFFLLVQQLWASGGPGNLANFLPSQWAASALSASLGEESPSRCVLPYRVFFSSRGPFLVFFISLYLFSYLTLIILYCKFLLFE